MGRITISLFGAIATGRHGVAPSVRAWILCAALALPALGEEISQSPLVIGVLGQNPVVRRTP